MERNTNFSDYDKINQFQIDILKNTFEKYFNNKQLKVLEIGVGNGKISNFLYENNHELYAIDMYKECLDKLNPLIKKNDFDLDVKNDFDIDSIPDDYFDLILIFEVLEHLKNPEFTLNFINKKLKRGGILIASTPNINWYAYRISFILGNSVEHFHNTNHVRYWNLKQFSNLIKVHFSIMNRFTQIRILHPFKFFFQKKLTIGNLTIENENIFYHSIHCNNSLFGDDQFIIAKRNNVLPNNT